MFINTKTILNVVFEKHVCLPIRWNYTQFKLKKRVTRNRIYMELWLTLDRIWILHQNLHSEKWSDKHVLFTAWLIGLGNENVQVSRDQLGNNIFYNTQKSFLQCNLDLFCFCNQRRITLLNLMINNCKIWNCIYMRICVSRFS